MFRNPLGSHILPYGEAYLLKFLLELILQVFNEFTPCYNTHSLKKLLATSLLNHQFLFLCTDRAEFFWDSSSFPTLTDFANLGNFSTYQSVGYFVPSWTALYKVSLETNVDADLYMNLLGSNNQSATVRAFF